MQSTDGVLGQPGIHRETLSQEEKQKLELCPGEQTQQHEGGPRQRESSRVEAASKTPTPKIAITVPEKVSPERGQLQWEVLRSIRLVPRPSKEPWERKDHDIRAILLGKICLTEI